MLLNPNQIKHASSPWQLQEHGEANHWFINDANNHWLAVLKFNGEYSTSRQKEYSHLIVTAPELLEVLQSIVKTTPPAICEWGGSECAFCGGGFSNHIGDFKHAEDCNFIKAEQVIDKAKGGVPPLTED